MDSGGGFLASIKKLDACCIASKIDADRYSYQAYVKTPFYRNEIKVHNKII